jgi:mannan endo-1,4-beta-mannosidase
MQLFQRLCLSAVLLATLVVPTITTASAASTPSVYWGAYLDGAPFNANVMNQFEADSGKKQSIVHWGQPWQMNGSMQSFQTQAYENVRLRGSIPMINWNSWNLNAPIDDPNYSLAKIYGGTYDAYITKWAQAAKAWGHPFFIRFDHEMNGWWYPWSEQRDGNHAGDYVKAWRHVVNIFRSVGATNATWVWCVNIASDVTTPVSALYPGDNYVDWLGMDGYNKATDTASWLSFNQIFGLHPWSKHNTYQELVNLAPSKPIMVAETATTNTGGDAAAWLRDALLTQLPQKFPNVKAFVWFNSNDGIASITYRIESSAAQQAAFKQGIASSYYGANTFGSLPFGPVRPIGASAQTVPPESETVTPTPTTTVTLKDVGDNYVDGSKPGSTAGGSSLRLIADGDPYSVAFLRFDLTSLKGKTITGATLRIHTTNDVGAGSNAAFDIQYVASNTWNGTTMSMNNSVPISSTKLGSLAAPAKGGTWYQTSLTPGGVQVGAGGLFSLAVKNSTNADGVIFNSKEGDPALTPQLVVSYK